MKVKKKAFKDYMKAIEGAVRPLFNWFFISTPGAGSTGGPRNVAMRFNAALKLVAIIDEK